MGLVYINYCALAGVKDERHLVVHICMFIETILTISMQGLLQEPIRNWASRQTQSRDWSGDSMHVCCAHLAIERLDVTADGFLTHHVRGITYSMQHRLGHERIVLQPVHPHKIASSIAASDARDELQSSGEGGLQVSEENSDFCKEEMLTTNLIGHAKMVVPSLL